MKSRPWLVVEVDRARDLAAVRPGCRGLELEARRVARLLSPTPPVWSAGARGWLVPALVAEDVIAYAQHAHQWVLAYDRKAV